MLDSIVGGISEGMQMLDSEGMESKRTTNQEESCKCDFRLIVYLMLLETGRPGKKV